ncbi:MAG TPA: phosphoribosylanthranilate isomerase [Casimicrobiaceae bacterium]|nr:phosphoribosylanthranilate isomerase [Casimicrobiaceae bacterium]
MPRTRVKICGITRPEDALAAARAGADAIGLVFWPGSARAVTHERARAIVAALPPFVTTVALFVDPSAEAVRAALAHVPLDLLQFHGAESAAFCRAFGRPYLKAVAASPGTDLLESLSPFDDAAGVLIDAPPLGGVPGGTGRTFDWSLLPPGLPRPLVLSGGLTVANVGEAVRRVRPWAVDVSSGVEAQDAAGAPLKGIKDAARIAAFIEEVRHAAS